MDKGLLGARPNLDCNKRKRDAESQYIASMIQGNPKMLLADSPLFQGLTQHHLPFSLTPCGSASDPQFQACIRLPLPDGQEAQGVGVARTKKEAERLAAVDACRKLNALGFLVGIFKSDSAVSGWGDNPKNALVTSVAFRDICCGGNARALPITLRASGPDHAKVFVAELAVPLPTEEKVFVALGQGRNKAEAERACCTAACEKLHQEGLLKKPGVLVGGTPNVPAPCSSKALQIQQQNEQPAIVGLQGEELVMIEDALHRLHMQMQEYNYVQRNHQPSAHQEADNNCVMQREALKMTTDFVSSEQLATENGMLRLEAIKRMSSSEYMEQRQKRQSLPSWKEREKIIGTIYNNQVVVLKGETGCGKTTQVPQFVLEDMELKDAGTGVHIVVTQPRRIAAIRVYGCKDSGTFVLVA